ncbi:MAG: hypothetical protein RLN77_01770 [Rhodospirillales bacterium]
MQQRHLAGAVPAAGFASGLAGSAAGFAAETVDLAGFWPVEKSLKDILIVSLVKRKYIRFIQVVINKLVFNIRLIFILFLIFVNFSIS